MNKDSYVLGFIYIEPTNSIVLVEKSEPIEMLGKLNGVGGKLDLNMDESVRETLSRNCVNKIGIPVPYNRWVDVATLEFPNKKIYVFGCKSKVPLDQHLKDMSDKEIVDHYDISNILKNDLAPHCEYLIPLTISTLEERIENMHYPIFTFT